MYLRLFFSCLLMTNIAYTATMHPAIPGQNDPYMVDSLEATTGRLVADWGGLKILSKALIPGPVSSIPVGNNAVLGSEMFLQSNGLNTFILYEFPPEKTTVFKLNTDGNYYPAVANTHYLKITSNGSEAVVYFVGQDNLTYLAFDLSSHQGRLIRMRASGAPATTYTYDSNHQLKTETDPYLNVTRYDYYGPTNPNGQATLCSMSNDGDSTSSGKLATITYPDGKVMCFTYQNNYVASVGGTSGKIYGFEWQSVGSAKRPYRVTEVAGNYVTQYSYGDDGSLWKEEMNGLRAIYYGYSADGNTVQVSRPAEGITSYTFDTERGWVKLKSVVDTVGAITEYAYTHLNNGNGYLLSSVTTTLPSGTSRATVYDYGTNPARPYRPVQINEGDTVVSATPSMTQLAYDAGGRSTFVRYERLGNTRALTYNGQGLLIEEREGGASQTDYVISHSYSGDYLTGTTVNGVPVFYRVNNADGQPLTETSGGRTTTYAYANTVGYTASLRGAPSQITHPDGTVENLFASQDTASSNQASTLALTSPTGVVYQETSSQSANMSFGTGGNSSTISQLLAQKIDNNVSSNATKTETVAYLSGQVGSSIYGIDQSTMSCQRANGSQANQELAFCPNDSAALSPNSNGPAATTLGFTVDRCTSKIQGTVTAADNSPVNGTIAVVMIPTANLSLSGLNLGNAFAAVARLGYSGTFPQIRQECVTAPTTPDCFGAYFVGFFAVTNGQFQWPLNNIPSQSLDFHVTYFENGNNGHLNSFASSQVVPVTSCAPTLASTVLTLDPAQTRYRWERAQFTAHLTRTDGSPVAGEVVQLYEGSQFLLQGTTDTNGNVPFTLNQRGVGAHALNAYHPASTSFAASNTGSLNFTVVSAATVMSLSGSPSNPTAGALVTYSGTLSFAPYIHDVTRFLNGSIACYLPSGSTLESGSVLFFSVANAQESFGFSFQARPTSGTITCNYVPSSGNSDTAASSTVISVNVTPTTTLSLVSLPATSQVGQSVPLNVQATPGESLINCGVEIRESNSNTLLASGFLNIAGQFVASYTFQNPGEKSIQVRRSACYAFPGETYTQSLQIVPAPSSTQLAQSSPSSAYGVSFTLSATVTATGGTPTGTVHFYRGKQSAGGTYIGFAQLNVYGIATFPFTDAAGTFTYYAYYTGSTRYNSSNTEASGISHTTNSPPVTLTLTSAGGNMGSQRGSIDILQGTSVINSNPLFEGNPNNLPLTISGPVTIKMKGVDANTGYLCFIGTPPPEISSFQAGYKQVTCSTPAGSYLQTCRKGEMSFSFNPAGRAVSISLDYQMGDACGGVGVLP